MNACDLELALKEIDAIAKKRQVDGWDGPGSRAFSPDTASAAKKLLPRLSIRPALAVNYDCSLEAIWYFGEAEEAVKEIRRKRICPISVQNYDRTSFCSITIEVDGSMGAEAALKVKDTPA